MVAVTRPRHTLKVLASLFFPILTLVLINRLDRLQYSPDAQWIIERAYQLVFKGQWPLAGNPFFGNLQLGPLADLLTALALFLTRDIMGVYYFPWLLYLAAILFFYWAIWLHFRNTDAALMASFLFGLGFVFNDNLMTALWNTSYLPLFLAGYFFLLLGDPRRSRLLVLYTFIGLCMQLHMSTIILIPSSWIFLRRRGRSLLLSLPWHVGGLLIIVLLHSTVLLYAFGNSGHYAESAGALADGLLRTFDWKVFVTYIGFSVLLGTPLAFAIPMLLSVKPQKWDCLKTKLKKFALIIALETMFIAILLGIKKEGPYSRYFLPGLPFYCYILAAIVSFVDERSSQQKRLFKLGLPITLFVAGFCMGFYLLASRRPAAGATLSENIAVVDQLHDWIRDKKIVGIGGFYESWFIVERNTYNYSASSSTSLSVLYCIRYPNLCPNVRNEDFIFVATFFTDYATHYLYNREFLRSDLQWPENCSGPICENKNMCSYFCLTKRIGQDKYCNSPSPLGLLFNCRGPLADIWNHNVYFVREPR